MSPFHPVRLATQLCLGTAGILAASTSVLGQAPVPGNTTVVIQGRGLGFEWILTIAMIGLALFVVCRSSRRN